MTLNSNAIESVSLSNKELKKLGFSTPLLHYYIETDNTKDFKVLVALEKGLTAQKDGRNLLDAVLKEHRGAKREEWLDLLWGLDPFFKSIKPLDKFKAFILYEEHAIGRRMFEDEESIKKALESCPLEVLTCAPKEFSEVFKKLSDKERKNIVLNGKGYSTGSVALFSKLIEEKQEEWIDFYFESLKTRKEPVKNFRTVTTKLYFPEKEKNERICILTEALYFERFDIAEKLLNAGYQINDGHMDYDDLFTMNLAVLRGVSIEGLEWLKGKGASLFMPKNFNHSFELPDANTVDFWQQTIDLDSEDFTVISWDVALKTAFATERAEQLCWLIDNGLSVKRETGKSISVEDAQKIESIYEAHKLKKQFGATGKKSKLTAL